jgi:hypothetical protein
MNRSQSRGKLEVHFSSRRGNLSMTMFLWNRPVETEKRSKKSTTIEARVQKTFGDNNKLIEYQVQVRNNERITGYSEIVACEEWKFLEESSVLFS